MIPRFNAAMRNERILAGLIAKPTSLQFYTERALAQPPVVFNEGEIMRGMRYPLMHRNGLGGFGHQGALAKVDEQEYNEQCYALLQALQDNPRPITPEHAAKGIAFWESMQKLDPRTARTSSTWRETKQVKALPQHVRYLMGTTFRCFEFVGYHDASDNPNRIVYTPIYRCHGRDCLGNPDHFDYTYTAWQSGNGGILIV
jgi:hypothetical protein